MGHGYSELDFCNSCILIDVSWGPDPNAVDIDVFSIKWNKSLYYIFPPFSVLMRTVRKISIDSTEAIVVVPNWKAQLLVDIPVLLPQMERLLYLAYAPRRRHKVRLRLTACRVSGNPLDHKIFLKRQSKSSSSHGDPVQRDSTSVILRSGVPSAENSVLIHFNRL